MDASGVTTRVGQLSGVFFHVDAFDLHTEFPRTIICGDHDVQVAIDAQGLVVLAHLIVLRHIGIEVVLPRKPAPRRDRAVQR